MKFNHGDVVYWVERSRHLPYPYRVAFGMVDEEFSDKVCIDRLSIMEHRLIDGIPYNDMPQYGHWQKLPKGWTYNTELFKLTWGELPDIPCDFKNPEQIKNAFYVGALVLLKDIDQSVPRAEIDKHLGWRFRKEYDESSYRYPYISMEKHKVYFTYKEALAEIDAIEAEWKRQAALTDEEWSIELIDKDLDRWAKIYSKSPEEKQAVRDWIMNLDKIDEVETRIFGGDFQWKYEKNKKWRTVIV